MTEPAALGLSRDALESMLVDTIGYLGADEPHLTTKLSAAIAAAIAANNEAIAASLARASAPRS